MPKFQLTLKFRDLLHAANLRHGTDGFTSPPKEGVLRIFFALKIRRLRPGVKPRTWLPKASTVLLEHRSSLKVVTNTNLKKLYNSLQSNRKIKPHQISFTNYFHFSVQHYVHIYIWFTKLREEQFRFTFNISLSPYNFTVQTVHIVNPPDIISPNGDWANVSNRTCIFLDNASNVAVNRSGSDQTIVPKSITCEL